MTICPVTVVSVTSQICDLSHGAAKRRLNPGYRKGGAALSLQVVQCSGGVVVYSTVQCSGGVVVYSTVQCSGGVVVYSTVQFDGGVVVYSTVHYVV